MNCKGKPESSNGIDEAGGGMHPARWGDRLRRTFGARVVFCAPAPTNHGKDFGAFPAFGGELQ